MQCPHGSGHTLSSAALGLRLRTVFADWSPVDTPSQVRPVLAATENGVWSDSGFPPPPPKLSMFLLKCGPGRLRLGGQRREGSIMAAQGQTAAARRALDSVSGFLTRTTSSRGHENSRSRLGAILGACSSPRATGREASLGNAYKALKGCLRPLRAL